MSPLSPRPDLERRGSSERVKSFVRRFSLPRRESFDKKGDKLGRRGSKSPGSTPTSPLSSFSPTSASEGRLPTIPPSPTTSVSDVSSWGQSNMLISSTSPASELPQTWAEYNDMYRRGLIDFNDPPPPPDSYGSLDSHFTATGVYRAPAPLNEAARQRSIDAIALLNHSQRRASGSAPNASRPVSEAESTSSTSSRSSTSTAPTSIAEEEEPVEEVVKPTEELVQPTEAGLYPPLPADLSTHPALVKLAQDAKARFGTNGSTVSLMDQGHQVFLAEEAFGGVQSLARENTACSHTQLKASATGEKDPFVVLDFAKDWRFKQNDFGQYSGGFYAAAPIMLPAPFGDEAGSYPAGIFCIIDEKPRESFSSEDRAHLEEMADLAGAEILRAAQEKEAQKAAQLKTKRNAWRKSKLVRRVSEKSNLDTVVEVMTPPASPEMIQLEDGMRSLGATMDNLISDSDSPSMENEVRRGSFPDSFDTVSDAGSQELGVTECTPTFGKKKGRKGVHAGSHRLSPDMKSVLDLSTQLVGESLDLDFCYVVAIDLPSSPASPRTTPEKPVTLLSGHNVPIPAPLFDVELHIETLTSHHNAILFTNPEFNGAEGDFSCGLLVKIAVADGVGFVLGAMSENPRRVLSDADYTFMKSFARDLSGWVKKM